MDETACESVLLPCEGSPSVPRMAPERIATFAERSVICPVLVGRGTALESGRQLLGRGRAGAGGILLVAGEAGMGKSRLLRETATEARSLGFLVLRGACFEADRAVPFAPLLDLVRELSATTSSAAVAHALAPAAAELVRAFPELAPIFSDPPHLQALDPEQERRRLFHAVAETITTLGRTQPVLLAIEDVQWGDEASLDLLLHLARRVTEQPVVLALSFRSDEVAPPLQRLLAELDRTRVVTELDLGRFSSAEISNMLSAIFDGAPPGGDFAATLHELTDGNPFFVEEVLKAMVSGGEVTRRADGGWHAQQLPRVHAPRTAVEAVRRRLSTLTTPARGVASVAAVAGRRFDFALLQSLTGHDEPALLAFIRELIAAQIVSEESPDRFAFRHALTREAILGELLARERAALHRAVADVLERQGGAPEAYIESLAYHAYGARDWPRALPGGRRAGRRAPPHARTCTRDARGPRRRARRVHHRARRGTPTIARRRSVGSPPRARHALGGARLSSRRPVPPRGARAGALDRRRLARRPGPQPRRQLARQPRPAGAGPARPSGRARSVPTAR